MQRFVAIALFVLVPYVALAQERQHQQSQSREDARYEILSDEGTVIRLDRHSGATAMFQTPVQGRDSGWAEIEHEDLPPGPDRPRFQLIHTATRSNRWLLLELGTGRTWLLTYSSNALRQVQYRWVPVADPSSR